jgi:hypothetical protein
MLFFIAKSGKKNIPLTFQLLAAATPLSVLSRKKKKTFYCKKNIF